MPPATSRVPASASRCESDVVGYGDAVPCADTLDVSNAHGRQASWRRIRRRRPAFRVARRRCDVQALHEYPADEVARLRDCVNDLDNIMALPARWTGGDPTQIASTLLDALLGMLRLGFACVRLHNLEGGRPIEMIRVSESLQRTADVRDIWRAVDASLGDEPLKLPSRTQIVLGGVELSEASARLGLRGELGTVTTGSPRSDFPTQAERLVLEVAANQAALGLVQAWRLHESERNARLLVDSIPGLVALLTSAGEVEFVNRQILEYTGRTLEELKQWGTNDTVHPEDLPKVVETFTQSIASGSPYEIVQRLRRADGVYLWFQNNGFPLRDASGRIARWCVLLTDVDERTRTEDALRESERESRLLVDSIPGLVATFTPEGEVESVNRQILHYFGRTLEQLRDWQDGGTTHPEDLPRVIELFGRSIASGDPFEFEVRARRFDGVYHWFQSRGFPLRDSNGQIVRWYHLLIDINDRKRAEEELRRSEAFLLEGQRLARIGNFVWRIATGEISWSEEIYRMFEFTPGTRVTLELLGSRVHPEDLPMLHDMVERAHRGESYFEYEHRLLMSDDSVKYLHLIAHVVRDDQNGLEYIGAVQDVTRRRLAEEALDKARSELARVARVATVSTLTASIAHEINQPLAGIITNAGTCLRMLDATPPNIDGARETARRTIRDGNRAADVITRLRTLFSKKEFALEPLDLNEATREVIALSSNDLQRSRIILQSELADSLPVVTGDRIQIQQVILNLLRNASDAMGDVLDRPRHLLIRTAWDDRDGVRLTVRDAGVGLQPQSLSSLFDAFYTTKSGGMGIGLFVSRSIVERHHGRLWAEPNDGEPGATFSFFIPRAAESTLDAFSPLRTS
jgi:PAS domain S-box-containing protein